MIEYTVVEYADGAKEWWLNGEQLTKKEFDKRQNSCDIKYTVKVSDNGSKVWWLNGKLHREDGPAVEYADGTKAWYLSGKLHREDGPAVEYADGMKVWWLNGKLHRKGGPAVERVDGTKEWWLNDEQLTKKEFDKRQNSCNNKVVEIDGRKYKLTPVD